MRSLALDAVCGLIVVALGAAAASLAPAPARAAVRVSEKIVEKVVEKGADEGEGPSIQVRARSELDGASEIRLGDIAAFKGFSPEEEAELRAVRLGDAPKRGESRSFTDVGLAQVFRSALRGRDRRESERIALTIPSKVTVAAKAASIDPKEAEAELVRMIKAVCGACDVDLANLALPAEAAQLPPGARWQIKMRPEPPRGPFSLPIEIRNGDGTRRLWWMSGVATLRKLAPVATRAIPAGERIVEKDWRLESRDVTYLPDPPPDASEMTSAWASRAISPGEIIGRSAFRREAAVKAGESVRVIAGSDEWQVAVEGVAQQGGFVGEMIRVRIPRTQKLVSGTLKEKGLVEVR